MPDDYDLGDSEEEGAPSAFKLTNADAKSQFNNVFKKVFKKPGGASVVGGNDGAGASAGKA